MRAFILSDINSPLDQVTALQFLVEGDAIDYYHRVTNQYQTTALNWCEYWDSVSIVYPMSQCTCLEC